MAFLTAIIAITLMLLISADISVLEMAERFYQLLGGKPMGTVTVGRMNDGNGIKR